MRLKERALTRQRSLEGGAGQRGPKGRATTGQVKSEEPTRQQSRVSQCEAAALRSEGTTAAGAETWRWPPLPLDAAAHPFELAMPSAPQPVHTHMHSHASAGVLGHSVQTSCSTVVLLQTSWLGVSHVHGVVSFGNCLRVEKKICLYEFSELSVLSVELQLPPKTSNTLID